MSRRKKKAVIIKNGSFYGTIDVSQAMTLNEVVREVESTLRRQYSWWSEKALGDSRVIEGREGDDVVEVYM